MPRTYKKVTNRVFLSETMENAVKDVIENNMSIRKSAEKNSVKKSALANYAKKAKELGIHNVNFIPNFCKSQVFTSEMETILVRYLLKCASMFYGLTPKQTRQLAYEFAVQNNLKIPVTWTKTKMAGKDWFSGFMSRNKNLSIRKPEATSVSRMASFNPVNLKTFQDKLELLIGRYALTPSQIFNLDETGVTTVQKVPKIVGKKGEHQVGQVVSRERGELVTQVGIICAAGSSLPPVWIFPRHRYDPKKMLNGVDENGPLGLVHPSGWMTSNNFLEVLKHIVTYTRCDKNNKILVIMDNHESHLSLPGIEYCRSNGIIILTLPPHTSNKLQPLDRTVFGSFKTFFNSGANSWMLNHPGQTLTIYDLPAICVQAWDKAATPANIKSGFKCTGIVPFNKNVFKEEDFLPAYVTDRPAATCMENQTTGQVTDTQQPSTSSASLEEISTPTNEKCFTDFVSPEVLRPFPKAPAKKGKNRGRKKGRCMVATDTPEKNEIEEQYQKKMEKSIKKIKRKIYQKDSSDEEKEEDIVLYATSSDDDLIFDNEDTDDENKIEEGDYIISKIFDADRKNSRNYVAQIGKLKKKGYHVQFLKRHVQSNRFSISNENAAYLPAEDVVIKLPKPIKDNRIRFKNMIYFNVDLTEFSLN